MVAESGRELEAAENIDIEQSLAVIEKGQQLAGHFPSAEALDSARRILTGELSVEDADLELDAALARIVARERDTLACRACGTWVCSECSARRPYASRFSEQEQRCARCAGTSGHMAPGTHRESRANDHDASYRRSLADEVELRYPVEKPGPR